MQLVVQAGRARMNVLGLVPSLRGEDERVAKALQKLAPQVLAIDLAMPDLMALRRAIAFHKPWNAGRLLRVWEKLLSQTGALASGEGYRAAVTYAQERGVELYPLASFGTELSLLDAWRAKRALSRIAERDPTRLRAAFEATLQSTRLGPRLRGDELAIIDRAYNLLFKDQLTRVVALITTPRAQRVSDAVIQRAGKGHAGPEGTEWR